MKGDHSINKKNWFYTLKDSFLTFGSESKKENIIEIIEIIDCEITGDKQAIIMIDRDHIEILYIRDILTDNELIRRLSIDDIMALSYWLATEQQAPGTQAEDLPPIKVVPQFWSALCFMK